MFLCMTAEHQADFVHSEIPFNLSHLFLIQLSSMLSRYDDQLFFDQRDRAVLC